MIIRGSFTQNLKQSGKVMNREVVRRNDILHVMSDGLKVDQVERHHIIPQESRDDLLGSIVSYALVDLAMDG